MKKSVFVFIIVLFFVNTSFAQTSEKLTNATIIKMVKAKLSDDLIIDEINNSSVNFNLSIDAVKSLSDQNVSTRVIQAMKATSGIQTSIIANDSVSQKSMLNTAVIVTLPIPVQASPIPLNDTLKQPKNEQILNKTIASSDSLKKEIKKIELIENSTLTINAISYIIPIEELIVFFDYKINVLSFLIKEKDNRIRDSIQEGNRINNKISQLEKELSNKKNADAKGYTNEISQLKKSLSEFRLNYKQFKNNMIVEGISIAKEVKEIGNETDRSISNKFNEVSQIVKKSYPDPSLGEILKSMTIPKQKINDSIVNYIAPLTEILFFCQNEINTLREVIVQWNAKALVIIQKDAELKKQLEPLNKQLLEYKLNAKKNKKEIATLKKQCAKIEKDRKQLTNQMQNDSKELSSYLKLICKEAQSSVKERFIDIVENINYAYQDKF